MKVLGFKARNTLFKFCEERAFCEDLAAGHLYMKANGYFRQLENMYRGDPFDGRIAVQKPARTIRLPLENGRVIEMESFEETVYGVDHDDHIPVFCAVMFDGAIVEPPEPGAAFTRFCTPFVRELSQFGRYVVCVDLDEVLETVQLFAWRKGYWCQHSKVHYFDTSSVFASVQDAKEAMACFPFAFFKKDLSYRWQNEWRCVLRSFDQPLIPEGMDHYMLHAEPFESARIFASEELLSASIEL